MSTYKTTFRLMTTFAVAILVSAAASAGYVTGTPDDTPGVYLFSAGSSAGWAWNPQGAPGGEPTDDIVQNALDYGILRFLGDQYAEQIGGHTGPGAEDSFSSTPDYEIYNGLRSINDFGLIDEHDDDGANVDLGKCGWIKVAFDPNEDDDPTLPPNPNPLVIVPDGIVSTGVLGPDVVGDAAQADLALAGFEILIFEDAELSGMTITLYGDGDSVSITLVDRQVDPLTEGGADDTLIAIDLDALIGAGLFDGKFVQYIKIKDDGVNMSICSGAYGPLYGDTTVEIDAIAARYYREESVIPEPATLSIVGLAASALALGRRR